MESLDKLIKENPHTDSISLEFSQISNLANLLPRLGQFKKLKELILHGNRLKNLPEDLSMLSHVEFLDISNNLFRDLEGALSGLQSLPRLKSLTLDLRGKEDEDLVIRALPRLEILNSTPIRSFSNNSKNSLSHGNTNATRQEDYASFDPREKQDLDESEIGIKRDDLDAVGLLYQCIKELFMEQNPEKDETLLEQFDDHVKHVMHDLSSKLAENEETAFKIVQVLKAKYALYEICFIKIIEFIANMDPRLSSILEGLHDAHAIIFKDLATNVNTTNFNNTNQSGFEKGSRDVAGGHNAPAELLEVAESLEKENNKLRSEREAMLAEFQQERNELLEELNSLRDENAKYLDTIVRHSKENADRFGTFPSQDFNSKGYELPPQKANYDSFAGNETMQQPIKVNNNVMNPANVYIGQTQVRALTLKQMKDVIEEIYTSKAKYDQRCLEAKLPRETMEQHMYTYLNQKYGLKNLIIEWATAIINGIKKFSIEDNDVAVFGKILRNECDEEFRFVQGQVKVTISELLRMYLRSRYPLKNNAEIKEMLNIRMSGSIQEEECIDIINYMYNQEDAEILLVKLKKFYIFPSKTAEMKRLSREEQMKLMSEKEKPIIDYNVFQKIILDFQLKSHEKFLKNFVQLFRRSDKDINGIIDEGEFKDMVNNMEKYSIQPDVQKLLMVVDPYNHQQITFSQCVSLFSAEMISDGENTFSILQKISLDQ